MITSCLTAEFDDRNNPVVITESDKRRTGPLLAPHPGRRLARQCSPIAERVRHRRAEEEKSRSARAR